MSRQVHLIGVNDAFYREFFSELYRNPEFRYSVCWALVEHPEISYVKMRNGMVFARPELLEEMHAEETAQKVGENSQPEGSDGRGQECLHLRDDDQNREGEETQEGKINESQ